MSSGAFQSADPRSLFLTLLLLVLTSCFWLSRVWSEQARVLSLERELTLYRHFSADGDSASARRWEQQQRQQQQQQQQWEKQRVQQLYECWNANNKIIALMNEELTILQGAVREHEQRGSQFLSSTLNARSHTDQSAQFRHYLHTRMSPEDCSAAPLLLHFQYNFGLGSDTFSLVYYLTVAHETGRALIIHSSGWPFSAAGEGGVSRGDLIQCPSGGWGCFFLPPSACSERHIGPFETKRWTPEDDASGTRVLSLDWNSWVDTHRGVRTLYQQKAMFEHFPASFTHRPSAWHCAHLMQFLLRPTPFVSSAVARARKQLQLMAHPVIGLLISSYVDMQAARRVIKRVADYMKETRALSQRLGINHIFISCQEPTIQLQELEREHPEFVFNYLPLLPPTASTMQKALQLVIEMFLLMEVDAFVAPLSMDLARVIAAVASASDRPHKEIVSLDLQDYNGCIL